MYLTKVALPQVDKITWSFEQPVVSSQAQMYPVIFQLMFQEGRCANKNLAKDFNEDFHKKLCQQMPGGGGTNEASGELIEV